MINSLTDYLVRSAEQQPEKLALVTDKGSLTYAELLNIANSVANYLKHLGIHHADHIVLALGNTVETVICFWGALLADAIVSIIDHQQPQEKIAYILNDLHASCVITDNCSQHSHPFSKLKHELHWLTSEIVEQSQSHSSDLNLNTQHLDIDLASIIYTSGSTGEPKGVMLTHRNMLAAAESINHYLNHSDNDTVICALPLSFDYGLYQLIMMTAVTGTVILEKDLLLPSQLLKHIEQYNVTGLPLVPSMVLLLVKFNQLKTYDLTSIRYVTNTGAQLMPSYIDAINTLLPHAKLFSMYGLTECKRCTYLPADHVDKKPTSIGIPIPNTQMWIVDDAGQRCGPNQLGEIVVRGQTVMQGYWNKPEESCQKLKPGRLPNEYLLFTGDLGWMDNDGYFYFHGRLDDVIKSRGMKVSPREIEMIVSQHQDIIEVAAVGVADPPNGQAIVLFVSLSNHNITTERLTVFCKRALQPHEQLVEIIIETTLPKTANRKIDKRALVKLYQDNNHTMRESNILKAF